MPWFKKRKSLQLKKRRKITKKDISSPTDFKHIHHAEYSDSLQGFAGLPPQWSSIINSKAEDQLSISTASHKHSLDTTLVAPNSPESGTLSPARQHHREPSVELEICTSPVQQLTASVQSDQEIPKRASKTSPCDSAASSKVSLVSSCSLGLSKRPSPIVRGPENCLPETIKYVRKHYRSSSHGNPIERELIREAHLLHRHSGQEQIAEEEFMRPRAGSYHQLRTSPVNRRQIVSYTPGGQISYSNDRLPPSFPLSAPNEVAKSDLGLYDCDNTYEPHTTALSRIYSPSESSGYFGSTRSSLNSSRMSSFQQLSSACSPSGMSHHPGVPPTRPLNPHQREHAEMVC